MTTKVFLDAAVLTAANEALDRLVASGASSTDFSVNPKRTGAPSLRLTPDPDEITVLGKLVRDEHTYYVGFVV